MVALSSHVCLAGNAACSALHYRDAQATYMSSTEQATLFKLRHATAQAPLCKNRS